MASLRTLAVLFSKPPTSELPWKPHGGGSLGRTPATASYSRVVGALVAK